MPRQLVAFLTIVAFLVLPLVKPDDLSVVHANQTRGALIERRLSGASNGQHKGKGGGKFEDSGRRKKQSISVLKSPEIKLASTTNSDLVNLLFNEFRTENRDADAVIKEIDDIVEILHEKKLTVSKDVNIYASTVRSEIAKKNLKQGNKISMSKKILEALSYKLLSADADGTEYIDNTHDEPFVSMVDIVFCFDSSAQISTVLTKWKEAINGYHLIIMFDTKETMDKFDPIPSFITDYEMYTLDDIRQALNTKTHGNMAWLLSDRGFDDYAGLRNFGVWVTKKDFVYVVDNESSPEGKDIFKKHLINMKTPSTPEYFTNFIDPFSAGFDFIKGHPYHLRQGVSTGASVGLVAGMLEYDSMTKLFKSKVDIPKAVRHDIRTMSLPYNQLFTISSNVMYNRAIMGSSLMYLPTQGRFKEFRHVGDIISGWVMKVCADNLKFGIKVGPPYITKKTLDHFEVAKRVKFDMTETNGTLLWDNRLFEMLNRFELNETTRVKNGMCSSRWLTTDCIHSEIAHLIERDYDFELGRLIKIWIYAWATRHDFLGITFPVASKSSLKPKPTATCALTTIVHNEKDLFPIWIRYYLRHFKPEDIFVYDHLTSDSTLDVLPLGVHLEKMEGNKYLMPVRFRSIFIGKKQDFLLRQGYKCVVFADTDEIIAANPEKYKGGLQDFFRAFVADELKLYYRVEALEIAHMGYGNGSKSTQEPPIDWSKNLMAQRHFYVPDNYYNKPLLVKVPAAYKPGFHKFYDIHRDRKVSVDIENFVMFHLRSIDYDFCLKREEVKYNMTHGMETIELHTGYASHWNQYTNDKKHGLLCKFANACFKGPLTDQTIFYDNTGQFLIKKMPNVWHMVDV